MVVVAPPGVGLQSNIPVQYSHELVRDEPWIVLASVERLLEEPVKANLPSPSKPGKRPFIPLPQKICDHTLVVLLSACTKQISIHNCNVIIKAHFESKFLLN